MKPTPKNPSTGFSRFVVDAMLERAREHCLKTPNDPACSGVSTIDFAMTNNGCFRTDIEAGPIYYGDLYRMMPFENTLEIIEITGRDVELLARIGSSDEKPGFQFAGLNVAFAEKALPETMKDLDGDGEIAAWERSRLLRVTLGRTPLDPDKIYRVVLHDFLGSGGDFTGMVMKRRKNRKRRMLINLNLRDVVAKQILKNYRIGGFEDDFRVIVE